MKKQNSTFALTTITDIQQIPPRQRTPENLRPLKTVSATCLSAEPAPKGSAQYQRVGVITKLGFIAMPVWEQLADALILRLYGKNSDGAEQILSIAVKSLLFGTAPEFYARSVLLEQRCAWELYRADKSLLLRAMQNPTTVQLIFRALGDETGPLLLLEDKARTDIVMHFCEAVYQSSGQRDYYAVVFDTANDMERYFLWMLMAVNGHPEQGAWANRSIVAFALSGEETVEINQAVSFLRKKGDISLVFLGEEPSEENPPAIKEMTQLLCNKQITPVTELGRALCNLK